MQPQTLSAIGGVFILCAGWVYVQAIIPTPPTHTALCIVLAQVSGLPAQKEQPVLKAQLLQGHLATADFKRRIGFLRPRSAQGTQRTIPMRITLTQHTE